MAGMSCVLSPGEQDPSSLTVDRISCLPWNVLDIILGKLSIIEAVRTSVLAKEWRYKWLSLSKFTLDYDVIADVLNTGDLGWDLISGITNKFLLNHSCTIKTFYLRTYCSPHYPDLYQWIQYLLKQDVEVMLLEELGSQPFEIPSHLFFYEKLQCLFLGSCALRVPSSFGSFNCLRELSLRDVSINDSDLHSLILACPLLVKLVLLRIYGLEHLRIHSPTLTALEIDTRVEDIVIEAAACLVSVCIKNAFRYQGMITNWQSVIHCLSGLNALQSLVLFGDFITILAADYAFENFQMRNDTLTLLSLRNLRFDNIEVFRVCLSLLSSCPNIKCFQFSIEAAKGPKLITTFLKDNRGWFSFPELDSIVVTCPSGTGMGCTVNFIEYLCAHSPNLKVLSIEKGGKLEMNITRVSKMLLRFRKVCPHASIQYT